MSLCGALCLSVSPMCSSLLFLSLSLSLSLSVCVSVYLCLSLCPSVSMFVYLSLRLKRWYLKMGNLKKWNAKK